MIPKQAYMLQNCLAHLSAKVAVFFVLAFHFIFSVLHTGFEQRDLDLAILSSNHSKSFHLSTSKFLEKRYLYYPTKTVTLKVTNVI